MLGITVADAVLVVGVLVTLLTAWRGGVAGDAAKKATPPTDTISVGAGVFADTAAMTALTAAITKLAETIDMGKEERERLHDEKVERMLREIHDGIRRA